MKKIPSLFVRDWDGDPSLVTDEVNPSCQWVIDGEGVATQKHDGTSCLVKNGEFFKRYTLRKGKAAPEGFVPATDLDENTGKQEGWVPVGDGPEDAWHNEVRNGLLTLGFWKYLDGTYELIGPMVQGNPEGVSYHKLVEHGSVKLPDAPRTYSELKGYLDGGGMEGIVWHHPDGRMAKIKATDLGVTR